jgi:hypothetical protein
MSSAYARYYTYDLSLVLINLLVKSKCVHAPSSLTNYITTSISNQNDIRGNYFSACLMRIMIICMHEQLHLARATELGFNIASKLTTTALFSEEIATNLSVFYFGRNESEIIRSRNNVLENYY